MLAAFQLTAMVFHNFRHLVEYILSNGNSSNFYLKGPPRPLLVEKRPKYRQGGVQQQDGANDFHVLNQFQVELAPGVVQPVVVPPGALATSG